MYFKQEKNQRLDDIQSYKKIKFMFSWIKHRLHDSFLIFNNKIYFPIYFPCIIDLTVPQIFKLDI